MINYQKILFILLLATSFFHIGAKAQAVTNIGDTITISKGDYMYINGGFTLQDSGKHFPYIFNNGKLEISGDFIKSNHSIYNGGQDSVLLTGTDSQQFPGFSYFVLSIDSGNIKNLDGKAYIRGQLILNRGFIHTKSDTIELDSIAIMKEDSTDYVTGNMTITRNLRKNVDYPNGNIGLELQALNAAPGITTIFRKTGADATQHDFCSEGIARYFDVKPNGSKLVAKLVFHYYPVELNGILKANLVYFQSNDYGVTWNNVGFSSRDAVLSTITMNATPPNGRLTLSDLFKGLVDPSKATGDTTICLGFAAPIGADSTSGHKYSWTSIPAGFSSQILTNTVKPKQGTVYLLTESVPNTSCVHTDSVKINVNALPDIAFKIVESNCNTFIFSANDTTQKGYSWDFGDGGTAQGAVAKHSFSKDSVYTVKMFSTNSSGCTGEHDSLFNFKAPGLDFRIYPNPVFDIANIRFNLCQSANVSITIWDEMGKYLGVVTDGEHPGGFYDYSLDFKANNWRSGNVFYPYHD